MKTAFMFAGQGAQYVGMGLDLIKQYPQLQRYIDKASKCLDIDVQALFLDESAYKKTYETQLMMVVTQVMYVELLKEKKVLPDVVLGFSLGDMTAHYAAGMISYETLLTLTAARAKAMQQACDAVPGTMAAVVKLPSQVIIDICKTYATTNSYMLPVNFNAPMQTVISGHKEALEDVSLALKEAGGRVIPLAVAGAFHTPIMTLFQDTYEEALEHAQLVDPICVILSNVSGQAIHSNYKEDMLKQISHPVQLVTMFETLKSFNIKTLIEIGPGNVLSGLASKQFEDITLKTLKNAQSVEDVL